MNSLAICIEYTYSYNPQAIYSLWGDFSLSLLHNYKSSIYVSDFYTFCQWFVWMRYSTELLSYIMSYNWLLKLTHIFQYLIKSDKKKNCDTVYMSFLFWGKFFKLIIWVKFIFLFNFSLYIYCILVLTVLIPVFDLISSVGTE